MYMYCLYMFVFLILTLIQPLMLNSALLKACTVDLDVNLGKQIYGQAISIGGFDSDLYVGNTLIDIYVKCGCLDCGRRLVDEMPERDVISWASLIVAYAKSGNMKAVSELFDGLPLKDMVAWTAIVTGYDQNARPRESSEYFERMQDAGVETDEVTLVGAISACAQLGAAKYANWVRDIAEKSGLAPTKNVVIGCSYLTTLGAASTLQEMSFIRDRIARRLARANGLIV